MRVHKGTYNTQGWRSREVEATRGHSSVLLDRRLNPRQESRDAGEDGVVLLAATLSKSFVDDSHKNMRTISIHNCKRSTTVSLCYNLREQLKHFVNYLPDMVHLQYSSHTQSGFRPQSGSFSSYSFWFRRWELQSHAACLWRSLGLQCLPNLVRNRKVKCLYCHAQCSPYTCPS